MCFYFDWQVFFIITHWRIFVHRLTFIEPRDYRVVLDIQKERATPKNATRVARYDYLLSKAILFDSLFTVFEYRVIENTQVIESDTSWVHTIP